METFDRTTSRLLPNVPDKEGNIPNHASIKMYGYWQRRKEIWKRRNRQALIPCRLGFTCLILLWSILSLLTTILSYFRLTVLLQSGYDKFKNGKTRYLNILH